LIDDEDEAPLPPPGVFVQQQRPPAQLAAAGRMGVGPNGGQRPATIPVTGATAIGTSSTVGPAPNTGVKKTPAGAMPPRPAARPGANPK
jgi:hypothetical protein